MIEKFRENDIDEIMQIWLNSNLEAHFFVDENFWKDNYDYVKEILPNANLYVYKEDGIIKGFIGMIDSHIEGIFVDKQYRNIGIGKLLLGEARKIHSILSLNVYKKNQGAVDFYKNSGFNIIEEKMEENFSEIEYLMKWEEE